MNESILFEYSLKSFMDRLRKYFEAMYSFELSHSEFYLRRLDQTLITRTNDFDVMIRIAKSRDDWPVNALVIKRLFFSEIGVGNGKHFLQFLFHLSEGYDITHVGIAELNPTLHELFRSYGFSNTSDNHFIKAIRSPEQL